MKKNSGPKSLQDKINEATKGIKCPIHAKAPVIKLNSDKEEVELECCCASFKMDVKVITDRVLKAWKLHGEHLRARRDERF
jgi:hypothetical protein